MRVEATQDERLALFTSFRTLWESGRFCDVTLQSHDGASFEAHRLVLAAASDILASLFGSSVFVETQGGPVRLEVSGNAIAALLRYIYCGEADVQPEDVPEALHLAHMYGLHGLQRRLAAVLPSQLNVAIAARVLLECDVLGDTDLEEECEAYVALNFEQFVKTEHLRKFAAHQLARVLQHRDLVVSREEVVLQAVIQWYKSEPGREQTANLLFQQVRFFSLSILSLGAVNVYAQAAGPCGVVLQRQAKRGLAVHHEVFAERPAKRRCLPYWWHGFGASAIGGESIFISDEQDTKYVIARCELHEDDLWVAELHWHRVFKMSYGSKQTRLVAGSEAPANGVNDLSRITDINVSSEGQLLVVDRPNKRIVRYTGTVGDVVWRGLKSPYAVCSTPNGTIYVLDAGRVRKLEAGVVSDATGPLSGSRYNLCVTAAGDVYVSDFDEHHVMRWDAAAATWVIVCGGTSAGDALSQLRKPAGIHVTGDGAVYIADFGNHRIMKWCPGAAVGQVVAGGHGAGTASHQVSEPWRVLCREDGGFFISERGRVTKWAPPTAVSLNF